MEIIRSKTVNYCESIEVQKTSFMQSCSVLLAVDSTELIIKYVSANCESLFKKAPSAMLGTRLDDYFSKRSLGRIQKKLRFSKEFQYFPRSVLALERNEPSSDKNTLSSLVYVQNGLLFVELSIDEVPVKENTLPSVEAIIDFITCFEGTQEFLAKAVCRIIRELTGFDRVYYCEFQEDLHGFVPADDVSSALKSLENHHFPASDVPMVVRKLYLKNRFRFISDSHSEPVSILGAGESLDLSQSLFRAISATHLEYLRNMGIQSSASFSVVEGSILRGILGCHSVNKKAIPLALFPKIQLIVEAFAGNLLNRMIKKDQNKEDVLNTAQTTNARANGMLKFLSEYVKTDCSFDLIQAETFKELATVFGADMYLACSETKFFSNVHLPDEFRISIDKYIKEQDSNQQIIVSDCNEALIPNYQQWNTLAAGMIAISIKPGHSKYLVFMKPETITQRMWSGNPNILSEKKDGKIGPRESFEAWREETRGKSEKWSPTKVETAKKLRESIIEIRSAQLLKLENTNELLSKKSQQNENLLAEVHHRVKNNLTIVNAIFDWKIKSTKSADLVLDLREMKARVLAIASLHQTLYQTGNFGEVDLNRYLRSISNEALRIFVSGNKTIQFKIQIPDGEKLPLQEALPMGLIVHEFITNSIKHGFLDRNTGLISLEISHSNNQTQIKLSDDGKGCPDIANIKGSSIGVQLIRLLVAQLDGEAAWNGSHGLSLNITLDRKLQTL